MKTLVLLSTLLACPQAASAGQLMASHTPTRSPAHEVARVNGVPLMSDRLDIALRALIPMESFHQSVSPAKIDQLRDRALNNLVDEELRYQDGVRSGFVPSEKDIDAGLARAIAGYKSREEFDRARRKAGAQISEIRAEIRRVLVIGKAYERQVGSRCQVGAEEAARFYAEFPRRFVVPEQLHLYAISIGVEPGAPSSQWIDARSKAEDLLRQIKDGASFEALAQKHSTDPSKDQGGDMGFVHRGSLNEQFELATRDMKPGELTGVIQTLYGFHIIKLAAIRPPQQKILADVTAGIQKDLSTKRCSEMSGAWIARLRVAATIVFTDSKAGRKTNASGAGDRQ